jgi:hypothetical protein
MLGEHYAGVRRWIPAFLATFTFQGVPAAASLLRGIDMLRDMNDAATPSLPKSAPTGFIRERWARLVLPGGAIDRRYYELCVLSELRDRLRAGDVWVLGSRRYRSFEERLISRETQQELQQSGTLPIAVDADFECFIAGRRALLEERLAAVELKAKGGLLPDVTIERGVLKITPIEKSTPREAEALAARLYAMLPRIRITDLLSEVAGWTLFIDCFTHLRSGETVADPRVLMASLLADGLNLGLDAHGGGLHDCQPWSARLGFARLPVRTTNPGPEEPPALQLCQAVGLPNARTADRRPHQRRADPRPLDGHPADRRLDPNRHGNGVADYAPAGLLPATERGGRGAPRVGPARAHAVHPRLDRGPGIAPADEPRA